MSSSMLAASILVVGLLVVLGLALARWQQPAALEDPAQARERGQDALRAGRLEHAQRLLARAVELDVTDPTGWYLLGEVYRLRGRLEFARACFDQAVRIHEERLAVDPSRPRDRAWRSFYRARRGLCPQALGDADALASEATAEVALVLAQTYAACGDGLAAEDLRRRAAALGGAAAAPWALELDPP